MGTLSSDRIPNPKEQCNAISLRSRKAVVVQNDKKKVEKEVEKRKFEKSGDKFEAEGKDEKMTKRNAMMESKGQQIEETVKLDLAAKVPFSQRLVDRRKEEKDKQFHKFLDMLKKLNLNILLVDVLIKIGCCSVHKGSFGLKAGVG
ncbi:hypothetical protein ACH5RR_001426 [Cinchona calisaya]|uniref:Uncharacterized protein n=1 Tax=Cinchona calisaya TaxID=153742 RepID=A0ABD3B3H3_9GENT